MAGDRLDSFYYAELGGNRGGAIGKVKLFSTLFRFRCIRYVEGDFSQLRGPGR